jgi:hypothetical protein
MKKLICNILLALVSINLCAQITISEENIQENVVVKPQPFDSLSDITLQENAIDYKKFIGYKLFGLPLSNKYVPKNNDDAQIYMVGLHTLVPYNYVEEHTPYDQTAEGKSMLTLRNPFITSKKQLKGNMLQLYEAEEKKYEQRFTKEITTYKAAYSYGRGYYTPYENIQNTYFTILDVEINDWNGERKNIFYNIDEWDNPNNAGSEACWIRFLLKNETTNDTLYWKVLAEYIPQSCFTLVPYFEKTVSLYKNKNLIATCKLQNLVDIETGESLTINPDEEWYCYNVTFLHTKENKLIEPFILLEKGRNRIKVSFNDLKKEIYCESDNIGLQYSPLFILKDKYDALVAEKQKSEEEIFAAQRERERQEELASQQRKEQLIKKYGSTYGLLIADDKICLKMTKEMCIEAWGEPYSINTTIVEGLTLEQWVYGLGTYVYFNNGIISGIQN